MDPKALEFFEKHQPFGLFWARSRRNELREVFNQHVHVPAVSGRLSVLDVGFGRLDELYKLLDYLPETTLVGLEVYGKRMKGMAHELKVYGHIRVVRGDLDALDFDEEYFHLVCAFNVLHLVADPAPPLCALARSVKKKGNLLLSFDLLAGPDGQVEPHAVKRLAPYQKHGVKVALHPDAYWKDQVAAAGFRVEKTFRTKSKTFYIWATR